MINQELIDSALDIRTLSHWYCISKELDNNYLLGMQSNVVSPDISNFESYWKGFVSKFGINATLIDYIQQHTRYYLTIDNVAPLSDQVKKKIENHDGFVTVRYETEQSEHNDQFNIDIPSRKVKLQASKKLLSRESKVFERMLNSEMIEARTSEMTVDSSNLYFEWMIDYIHLGYLGVDKTTFESNTETEPTIEINDLIGLLQMADEYQVENLTKSIAKVCNSYNALTISLTAVELSEDCKSIIYEQTIPIISSQPACIVCDPIYRKVEYRDLEEEIDYFKIQDKNVFKQTIMQQAPLLTDIHSMTIYALGKTAHNKVIGRIPFELLKPILLNILSNNDLLSVVSFLNLWLIADYEAKYEEAFKFLIENIDFSNIKDDGILFAFFSIFTIIGKEDQFANLKNQFKDIMLKSLLIQKGYPRELAKLEEIKPSSEIIKKHKFVKKNVMFIGPEGSGKTTLLYKWYLDEVVLTTPTTKFNSQTINYKDNIDFVIRDFGGSDFSWKDYAQETDFVMFIHDSASFEREIIDFLWKVNEIIPKNIPLIVFCNRQDLPGAASIATITNHFNLNEITDRKWKIQSGCAITGHGIEESIGYLMSFFAPGKIECFGDIQNNVPADWLL